MSAESLRQAVALLGSLDAAELEQLGGHVAAMRSVSGPVPASPRAGTGPAASDNAFPALLYAALCAELQAETGAAAAPYGVFLQRQAGKAYTAHVGAVQAIHAGWFPKATRSESAALCRIYARCVLGQLKEHHSRLEWGSICSSLARFAGVMGDCFPGYAKQGLMSILLRIPTLHGYEGAHSP